MTEQRASRAAVANRGNQDEATQGCSRNTLISSGFRQEKARLTQAPTLR